MTAVCTSHSLHELSSRLTFCWGVISSCCSKTLVSDSFEWITSYSRVIRQLGRVYGTYCRQRELKNSECILAVNSLPSDVEDCPSSDVRKFFLWVAKSHQMLGSWHQKFESKHINYDDILLYKKHFSQINTLAASLSVDSLVVEIHYIQAVRQEFLQNFEILNIFLLRYVPGQPDVGW